ncbi:MAG: DNA repair protein RecO [Candidatus Sumerlaeaceae bacterium]|nr:DNA repair protein RecO [Candidatus Sumerlaeaceae bacterium]
MNDEYIQESSAIVLDCRAYRETSQILVLLSEHYGRVEAVGRGSRKSKGSIPDRFCQIYAVWRKPKEAHALVTLSRWEIEREFPPLRTSILAYALASLWAEALLALVAEGQEGGTSFEHTLHFLDALCLPNTANRLRWEILRMFWQLLQIQGFVGHWESCVLCGSRERLCFFSFEEMGPVCPPCASRRSESLYPLNELLARKLAEKVSAERQALAMPPRLGAEFFALYDFIIAHLSGRHLPSLPVLFELLGLHARLRSDASIFHC